MNKTASKTTRAALVDKTSFIGRCIFTYVYPVFVTGVRNGGLHISDIDHCSKYDNVDHNTHRLRARWADNVKHQRKPSLAGALFRAFFPYFIIPLLVSIFEECVVRIAQPLFLGYVIRYFSGGSNITRTEACYYAAGVCVCTMMYICTHHPLMIHLMRLGMRIRVAACALMYEKSLKLSRASINQTAVGQIVNIMSNDVNRFDDFALYTSYLIVGPLQMMIIIYIVYDSLGVSCMAGIACLCLLIPFQALMGRFFSIVRSKTAKLTDRRLKFMSEIISGMRVIKMYNWELPFASRVSEARKNEVKQVQISLFLKSINISMFFVASRVILFACLFLYAMLNNVLTAENVFVTMAMFNTLRLSMTLMFPQAITSASELKISIKRIQEFLLLEEISQKNRVAARQESVGKDATLEMSRVCARWNPDYPQPTLQDLSIYLEPGELLAVIGPVGAGKTALLMSILGELPLTSGEIRMKGSLSYASQETWSFNDSIRNNILFGRDYEEKKYRRVVEVCALERDFELLPLGDRSLVGEKGVQLSGGQKARLNLARAIYRDSDIMIMDDPLSAVDSAVAEHILEKCILEHLKDKIRILVTHQIQFVERASKILVLQNGRCTAFGTYEELLKMGVDFMSLLESDNDDDDEDGDSVNVNGRRTRKLSEISLEMSQNAVEGRTKSISRSSGRISRIVEEEEETSDTDEPDEETPVIKIEDEKPSTGAIKAQVYMTYLRAGSSFCLVLGTLVFSVISQFFFHGTDIFLAYWTNKNQQKIGDEDLAEEQQRDSLIYALIIVVLFVSTLIRSVTFFAISNRASRNLHNQIFAKLLRAPIAFFDQNPVGRILNRFTKDLGIIDESLPYVAFDLYLILAQAVGIVVTVSLVNWYLIFPALVLSICIFYLRRIYIISARDIKRIEGLARSPIYSHVDTTINGLTSIRAYSAQTEFEQQYRVFQDDHSAAWFTFIATSRCMGLATDVLALTYIVIITASIMFGQDDQLGGNVGLILSSGLMLAGMCQWGVRQSCEFESQMTSVERIVEYQSLDQEAPAKTESMQLSPQWPQDGQIEFQQMSLSYGGNKNVLQDLTCKIFGGEKIGIVGRTGAGKSSTIGALFRLTEPTGKILIDGVDIQKIGLNDLRQNISIIPQDPVIFSGSVRYNLDPFEEYSDESIWESLDKVQLREAVANFPGKLDAPLSEGGANLSVGQRQLICLARAILRQNRILIMDEATANVDFQTDQLIQSQLRTQFSECTVLTIAHRLNSIIDADRVLVLDAGQIIEFDAPYLLLKEKGMFYQMCKRTGESMFAHLYRTAKQAHRTQSSKTNTSSSSSTSLASTSD